MKILIILIASIFSLLACTTTAGLRQSSEEITDQEPWANQEEYSKLFAEPTEPFENCKFERLIDDFGSPDGYRSVGKCRFKLGATPQYCEKVESCDEGAKASVCRSIWNAKREKFEGLDTKQLPQSKLGEELNVEAEVTIKNRDDLMVEGCEGSIYAFKKVRVVSRALASGTQCFDYPLHANNTAASAKNSQELTMNLSQALNIPVECQSKEVCNRVLARKTKSPLVKLCVNPTSKKALISDVKKSTVTSSY
jgi:hypothetical protein